MILLILAVPHSVSFKVGNINCHGTRYNNSSQCLSSNHPWQHDSYHQRTWISHESSGFSSFSISSYLRTVSSTIMLASKESSNLPQRSSAFHFVSALRSPCAAGARKRVKPPDFFAGSNGSHEQPYAANQCQTPAAPANNTCAGTRGSRSTGRLHHDCQWRICRCVKHGWSRAWWKQFARQCKGYKMLQRLIAKARNARKP